MVMFIWREWDRRAKKPRRRALKAGQRHRRQAAQRARRATCKLAWFDKYTRFDNLSPKPYQEFEGPQEDF